MKFKRKPQIKIGTIRIVKRFAFFPITTRIKRLLETKETVWLQTVYLRQRRISGFSNYGEFGYPDMWINIEFLTKEDYLNFIKTSI
jgi:hypothetical protein